MGEETTPSRHLEGLLRQHVEVLAGQIGERNVFRPYSLEQASDYISSAWHEMGYQVRPWKFVVQKVECMNLEAFCRTVTSSMKARGWGRKTPRVQRHHRQCYFSGVHQLQQCAGIRTGCYDQEHSRWLRRGRL